MELTCCSSRNSSDIIISHDIGHCRVGTDCSSRRLGGACDSYTNIGLILLLMTATVSRFRCATQFGFHFDFGSGK